MPTCVVLVTAGEQQRREPAAQREHAARGARLGDERENPAPLLAERLGRGAAGSGGTRSTQRRRSTRSQITCAMTTPAIARTSPYCAPIGDAGEAQDHRPDEEPGADVVAAAEIERGAGEPLDRLAERDQRRDDERLRQPRRDERRENEQREPAEHRAGELEPERAAEEAPQQAPLRPRDEAEAVLHERLLDGQVEERLEESRRVDDGREVAELLLREDSASRRRSRGTRAATDE